MRSVSRRRALVFTLLVCLIGGLHLWVTHSLVERMDELVARSAPPKRMTAQYVSTVRISAPPKPRAAPAAKRLASVPKPRRRAAEVAQAAAAEPSPAAIAASAPLAAAASSPEAAASVAAPAEAAASAASAADAAEASTAAGTAATADAFEWPTATRLRYKLTGNFRGELNGSSQVEWVRQGTHYQVNVDTRIGLGLIKRSVSSDGELTAEGLRPKRFDESTQGLFVKMFTGTVLLNDDEVLMPDGRREPRQPGVQDEASQFVHLTYNLIQRPELTQAGAWIELPLILRRKGEFKQRPFIYDVLGLESIDTPLGKLDAVHLRPRKPQANEGSQDVTVDFWFAPALEYLPVRIKISQNEQNYIDLTITEAPQRAAPSALAPAASASAPPASH